MTYVRLSIPGNACTLCEAIIGQSLVCPGCGWVDPLTKRPNESLPDAGNSAEADWP